MSTKEVSALLFTSVLACSLVGSQAMQMDFANNPVFSFMVMDMTKEIVKSVSTSEEYKEGVVLLKEFVVYYLCLIKAAVFAYVLYRAYKMGEKFRTVWRRKIGHDLEWSRRTNMTPKNESLPDEFLFIGKHFEGIGGLQMTLTDLDKQMYKVKIPTKQTPTLTYEKNGKEWFTITLQSQPPSNVDKIVERHIFMVRFHSQLIYEKYLELEEEWRKSRSSHSRGYEVVRNAMDEQNPYTVKGGYQLEAKAPYSSQLLIMKKVQRLLSRGFCPMIILSSLPGSGKTVLSKLMARYVNWNLMKVSQSESSLWFDPHDGPTHLIQFFKFLQDKSNGADKYLVFCDEFDSFVKFLRGDYEDLKLSPAQIRRLTCILKEYIGNIQCVLVIATNEKLENNDLEVSGLHDRTIIFNPQGIELAEWMESLLNDPLNLDLFSFSEKEGIECFRSIFEKEDYANIMDSRFFKMMVEDNIVEFQHECQKIQKEQKSATAVRRISAEDFKLILQNAKACYHRRFGNSGMFYNRMHDYESGYQPEHLPPLSRQNSCESSKEKTKSIALAVATAVNIKDVKKENATVATAVH